MNQGPESPTAQIGDLVICRDPSRRESLKVPDEPGLVAELRKGQAKVFYPSVLGEIWLHHHSLSRILNPRTAPGVAPWLTRVWSLARILGAEEIAIERFGPEGNAVRLFHAAVEVEVLDEVRHDLGAELRYYGVGPASMHRMESSIAFVVEGPVTGPARPR